MKRISYAGSSVLTGDEIADALLCYAEALVNNDSAAAIEMPVRRHDGSVVTASLLIGPASQLVMLPEADDGAGELTDDELVRVLRIRTRGLLSPRPVVADGSDRGEAALIDELEYPGPIAD